MKELLFFLPFYLVAFAALFALWRPAWLAGGAVAAALLVMLLFRLLDQGGGGEGALAGYLLIIVIAIGFATGGVARLAVLLLGLRWPDRPFDRPVALLFFLGVPLTLAAYGQLRDAENRRRYAPPSEECRGRIHRVQLGDRWLGLPLVPGVTVGEGRRFQPRTSTAIPEQERVFCERTARATVRVTSIAIELSQLGAPVEAHPRPICRRPRQEAWWPLLCRFTRPERMEIYGIYLLDAGRYDQRAYPDFRVDPRRGDPQALDPRWERAGAFARLDMGHEIYWRGPLMPGAASPWSARCHRNSSTSRIGVWRCKAGYMMTPRVALIYDFLTPDDDVAGAALSTDDRVAKIARSLIAREPTVPERQ